jgi:predicted TIM-barrel fold metal-dependent hydrolase
MTEWSSKTQGIVDSHAHMGSLGEEASMVRICEAAGIEKMNLVAIQDPQSWAEIPESLYMKALYPHRFYVFAGLNHAARLSGGRVRTPSLAEQVDISVQMGCDGLKMIEGKPTARQRMDIPVTDPYFADYWAHVEELDIPIVWHVNDPEEFWDPARIPGWAKAQNWGYGPNDVQKEALYAEVDEVLARHPKLRIVFAHFYFLSADLARARRFFGEHPTVHFDLAPGIELLYNLSRNPDASRAFLIEHADRILFGTDISSNLTVEQGRLRAGIVMHWLETEDTFRIPRGTDVLLGPPEEGLIRGVSLPADVLAKIYHDNFYRLAGTEPRALDVQRAIVECERLAITDGAILDKSASETEAALVAKRLAGLA